MRVIQTGLQNAVVSSYDNTKTTIFGRVFQKTLNSQLVLGPPLTNFIDVFTSSGLTPAMHFHSPNGRMFVVSAPLAGVMVMALYTFDVNGVNPPVYIGKINLSLPNTAATTQTIRAMKIIDFASNATAFQIFFATTGSVLINGGMFYAYGILQSDFVQTSIPTFGMAIASSSRAVYMLQDPGNIGVNQNLTQAAGLIQDAANSKVYMLNGVAATCQYVKWDVSVAPTITIQTTTAPTVNGTATFTLTAHGYNANDPVVLLTNVPTAFTATTSTVQTVYFIRNQTANTFELSATSGGASITNTSVTSSTTIARAFGTTTANWMSVKTGNISGFAGNLLLTNSQSYAVPTDTNVPAGLINQPCGFLSTSTAFYLFKLSEVTNGAVTLPSMTTVNQSGTGSDYTAIAPSIAIYSNDISQAVYTSNTSTFYAKFWQNSIIKQAFGGLATTWVENTNPQTITFAAASVATMDAQMGWLTIATATVGQRGIFYMDLKSDTAYGYSYLISPVTLVASGIWGFIDSYEQLFDITDSLQFSYRTASTASDPTFNNPGGAWTVVPFSKALTLFALSNYIQIRLDFFIATLLENTPAQVNDVLLGITGLNEISNNWEGSVDNTSANGTSPAYTAFRLTLAYATSVPTMYFRAYDDNGNLVASANTASNPTFFNYTTNNGSSWNALGTVPNTPLTTELRYAWASPPGVRVSCSIRES